MSAALHDKRRDAGAPQQVSGTEPDGASADHDHFKCSFAA